MSTKGTSLGGEAVGGETPGPWHGAGAMSVAAAQIAASAPEVSLGRLLVAAGKLTPAALDRAERLHAESGERLDGILTKLGLVSEQDLAATLAAELGLPLLSAADFPD